MRVCSLLKVSSIYSKYAVECKDPNTYGFSRPMTHADFYLKYGSYYVVELFPISDTCLGVVVKKNAR